MTSIERKLSMYAPLILSLLLLTSCATDAMQQQEATEQSCSSSQHCPCAQQLKAIETHALLMYKATIENIEAMSACIVRISNDQKNISEIVKASMMQQQQQDLFAPPLLPSSVSSIPDVQPLPSPQSLPSSEQDNPIDFTEAPKINVARSALRLKNAIQVGKHRKIVMRRNEIIAILEKEGPLHRDEIFQRMTTKATPKTTTKDLMYLRAHGTLEYNNKQWKIAQNL
jgi:hypothetical protein